MGYRIAGTDLEADSIYTAVQFEHAIEQRELKLFRERCSPEIAADVRAKAIEQVFASGIFRAVAKKN